MRDEKWYRVTDPLSPLYGCDVSGFVHHRFDGWFVIERMRRIDILVGDRPFQLIAPEGQTLGLCIDLELLSESPLQDETVEIGVDRPFGRCISESSMTTDGYTLNIAEYEGAAQVALLTEDGTLLASRTFLRPPGEGIDWAKAGPKGAIEMFEDREFDQLTWVLKRGRD